MRPMQHAIATAAAAVPVYHATGSAAAVLCFAAPAVLMDVDHLIDFALWEKESRSPMRLFVPGVANKWPRIIFLFHGYEWIAAALYLAWKVSTPAAWAFAAGMLFHLLLDETGNRLPSNRTKIFPFFYFFTYRLALGFRRDRISVQRGAAAAR